MQVCGLFIGYKSQSFREESIWVKGKPRFYAKSLAIHASTDMFSKYSHLYIAWLFISHCYSGLLVWHAGRYSLLARFPMVEWTHSQWSNYWRVEEDSTNPQMQLAQRKCELYLQQVVTQVGVNALQNQFRLILSTFISPTLILPTEDQFVSST